MNKQLFKATALLAGLNMKNIAEALGINTTTLYRKLNNESDFTRAEIQSLRKLLKITPQEVENIFFAD